MAIGPSENEPSKCVRLDDDKKRRESADSGTSSVEHIHRMESPGSHRKSESDSGREETPGRLQESPSSSARLDELRRNAKKSANPHSVMNLVGNGNAGSSPGSSSATLSNPSAFSNPSLHSAAVHHRNLQAAAAQAMQYQHLLPGFQFPLGIHSLISQQGISPLLMPHYNPILQARQNNPLSKYYQSLYHKLNSVFCLYRMSKMNAV